MELVTSPVLNMRLAAVAVIGIVRIVSANTEKHTIVFIVTPARCGGFLQLNVFKS
jgi:hypothetical protein